jgi:seryl-tRNA(Sec) selenium transferase
LPLLELPTRCVAIRIRGRSTSAAEKILRGQSPPVIARIEDDYLLLDARTLAEDETPLILDAFTHLVRNLEHENR